MLTTTRSPEGCRAGRGPGLSPGPGLIFTGGKTEARGKVAKDTQPGTCRLPNSLQDPKPQFNFSMELPSLHPKGEGGPQGLGMGLRFCSSATPGRPVARERGTPSGPTM